MKKIIVLITVIISFFSASCVYADACESYWNGYRPSNCTGNASMGAGGSRMNSMACKITKIECKDSGKQYVCPDIEGSWTSFFKKKGNFKVNNDKATFNNKPCRAS